MPRVKKTAYARPRVEALEPREAPSATPFLLENFDTTTAGRLPAGWSQWSSAAPAFAVSTSRALSDGHGLSLSASLSNLAARAWLDDALPADTRVGAAVYLDTLIPAQLFARGTALQTSRPSYYALSLSRGLELRLLRVVDGVTTTLATLKSVGYFSGRWVRAALDLEGTTLRAQVVRTDTGQYLNAQGQWQTAAAWALERTDGALTAGGQAGLGRPGSYTGTVTFDDFGVTLPAVVETFDQAAAGSVPAGWAQWSSSGSVAFAVSAGESFSAPNSFAVTAPYSNSAARAWAEGVALADFEVSAAVYVNTLIPAQVFGRGTSLASPSPSYYAVVLTRGLAAQLLRVKDGVSTTLGEVRSARYLEGSWVRATLSAAGNLLRARVQRLDTGQYLNSAGEWQDQPAWALSVTDTVLTAPGLAGLARPASYTGTVRFDDFVLLPPGADTQAPAVTISEPSPGTTLSGIVRVEAEVRDSVALARVEFEVDGVRRAVATRGPFAWDVDTGSMANGEHALTVIAHDLAGNAGRATLIVTTQNAGALTPPAIPRHYGHIRIAELAYKGTPLTSFERGLLANSVDLVVADAATLLKEIDAAAPQTPQLIYTNVTSLYEELLSDWLTYADSRGASRESAFYHVARATSFAGDSPSSRPVNQFWAVYRSGNTWADLTSRAKDATPADLAFPAAGEALYVGYPEQFREINVTLSAGAAGGWSALLEYPTAVDARGVPTAWAPLRLIADTTLGLTRSGQVLFDPPADWKPASLNGSARLYYVRFRTTAAGTAPVGSTLLGRDYVQARGTTCGVIPAFDAAADRNGDGYLDDTEYARRTAGSDARFVYESRAFYASYGQMRFAANPADAVFRDWAVDYHRRLLDRHTLAEGLFVDNSTGVAPVSGSTVRESVAGYADNYATLLGAIGEAVAPRWLLANTAGGGTSADAVVRQVPAYYEEFALRPLAHSYRQFEDVAAMVARRAAVRSPAPYVVLDSLPTGGSPTDPRTQLATLAYYYLLADPDHTFLNFFGGYEPAGSWTRHWSAAAASDVGAPTASWSLFASGADPSAPARTYRVYQRPYVNALILYKPLSQGSDGIAGALDDATATTHRLDGPYFPLRADGTLGPSVTSVTLRNGEGAILVRA